MHRGTAKRHALAASALTALLALAAPTAGCRRGAQSNANGAAPDQTAAAQPGAGAPANDAAKLDSDIDRLERQAERNPADEATRDELAGAYVRRGNARRGAGQLREALADYQSALRLDPDSEDAQSGAASIKEQIGGEQEDENGAPAPLPITPHVADEEGKASPTATPKKQ